MKGKKSKLLIAAIVVLVIACIAAGAFYIFRGNLNSKSGDLELINKYIKSSNIKEYGDIFGSMDDMYANIVKNGYSSDMQYSVNIQDEKGTLKSLGDLYFNYKVTVDKDENTYLSLGAGLGSSSLLGAGMLFEGDNLSISAPTFTNKIIKVALDESFRSKLDSAVVSKVMSAESKDQLSKQVQFFKDNTSGNKIYKAEYHLLKNKKLKDIFVDYFKKADVVDKNAVKEHPVEGDIVKFKGTKYKLTKENTKLMFDEYKKLIFEDAEFKANVTDILLPLFSEKSVEDSAASYDENVNKLLDGLKDDIYVSIYSYNNNLAAIDVEVTDINEVVSTASFVDNGGKYSFENFELTLLGGNEYECKLDMVTNRENEGAEKDVITYKPYFYVNESGAKKVDLSSEINFNMNDLSYSGSVEGNVEDKNQIKIVFGGQYKDVVKGLKYSFELDKFELFTNNKPLLNGTFKGSYDASEEVNIDKTEFESENTFDLLTQDSEAFNEFSLEIQSNMLKLYPLLMGIN